MIRHLFKIIWNERSANTWIVLEYVIVFCILWFCCDYLYYIGKSYYEPLGFDLNHTYMIQMAKKNPEEASSGLRFEFGYESENRTEEDNITDAMTLMERLKQYPGIEYVSFSDASMPYSNSAIGMNLLINADTISQQFSIHRVSSEFFDVFRIKIEKGQYFDWTDPASKNQVLISPDRNGFFGDSKTSAYPAFEVDSLAYNRNEGSPHRVIGVTQKMKNSFFAPYNYSIIRPLNKERINLLSEITIRIHPNAAKGFEERFVKEMKEQLNIGPYRFSTINSLKNLEKSRMKGSGITNNLNSVYAITLFLIINIFLGIIGTFWYRTESRVSEIGLRIALGSSKRQIKTFLYTETVLLLLISAVIGVNICVNIGQTDLLKALGIPQAVPEQIGSGVEQYFINFGLTFLFLATISLLAVWYPARQASNMHPAEALHEE